MKGQYGNPNSISDFRRSNNAYGYDTNRVRVLDIEFYSTNEMVYEQRVDRRGNLIFGRAGFEDRNKIKDWLEFDIQKTQKYDIAMAAGYALIANKRIVNKQKSISGIDINSLFPKYKTNG